MTIYIISTPLIWECAQYIVFKSLVITSVSSPTYADSSLELRSLNSGVSPIQLLIQYFLLGQGETQQQADQATEFVS